MFDEHTAIGLDRRSLSEVDWIWPPGLPGRLDQKPQNYNKNDKFWSLLATENENVEIKIENFWKRINVTKIQKQMLIYKSVTLLCSS